jgi:chromate transport protein ChrA
MKEKISIPGPAKAIYATYLSALAVSIYAGFNNFHPFLSGWRYPWQMGFAKNLGLVSIWVMVLAAGVYLYYDTLGRPKGWNEPLRWFRIVLALLAIWYFLLSFAVYDPNGWLKGLVGGLGGISGTWKVYSVFLWVVLLANIIYVYARWAKSERFPRFKAVSSGEEV